MGSVDQALAKKLIIAISSRVLFDLDESNRVYEEQGTRTYARYQIERENEILAPGVAFNLVEKLLNLKDRTADTEPLVEVVLISRNSADTGLRIFNSIEHYGLNITRATFSDGRNPYPYLKAFGAHLFLSAHPNDVKSALENQCAAATILPMTAKNQQDQILRIAFDGDAVLFSDEAERIFQSEGLDAFIENEKQAAQDPLDPGPFKGFLEMLNRLQAHFDPENCPIRTALVTARQAPAHKRVIHTLRAWKIRLDEMIFLGGMDKGSFLKAFDADFFFDDQKGHCQSASQHVATGHVPHGVRN